MCEERIQGAFVEKRSLCDESGESADECLVSGQLGDALLYSALWRTWKWIVADVVVSAVAGVATSFVNKEVFGIVAPIVTKAKRGTDFSSGEQACYRLLQESDVTRIFLGVSIAVLLIIKIF